MKQIPLSSGYTLILPDLQKVSLYLDERVKALENQKGDINNV